MANEEIDVLAPTIHLNGTAGETLSDQYFTAIQQLGRALELVYDAAPNARDYYLQGPDAFARAMGEHKARLHKLTEVRAELRQIYGSIEDQLAARKERHGK